MVEAMQDAASFYSGDFYFKRLGQQAPEFSTLCGNMADVIEVNGRYEYTGVSFSPISAG